MIEFNGEEDHIHLLFQYYPQMELPKFISNLKSISSRRIRNEFSERVDKFYWKAVFWNESYFIASCGGVTVSVLKKYIEKQDSPELENSGVPWALAEGGIEPHRQPLLSSRRSPYRVERGASRRLAKSAHLKWISLSS